MLQYCVNKWNEINYNFSIAILVYTTFKLRLEFYLTNIYIYIYMYEDVSFYIIAIRKTGTIVIEITVFDSTLRSFLNQNFNS